ncbi:hypothetical protein ACC805_37800, partial [Rhizobium ruizarguesonis]
RLEWQFIRWKWLPKELNVIRIDIDPTEMVRRKPNVGVGADAKAGTQALLDALAGSGRMDSTREVAERNEEARSRFSAV